MKFVYYKFLTTALAAMLLLSCCEEKPIRPPEPEPAKRVLLMYDNIGSYFADNANAAGKAVAAGALGRDERVIVYHRSSNSIYELVKDSSQEEGFARKERKKYAAGENARLSKETIANIVGDVRALFPKADQWGLAFGSHGKGWIPVSSRVSVSRSKATPTVSEHPFSELWIIPENPLTRYLAYNNNEKIDVGEFADALDEWEWDFILLDDCFMASTEALYEIRTLADYFIASPTEIIIDGFPYDRVVSTLFANWKTDLEGALADVADGFVEAYRADIMHPGYPHATIAVVKTSELDALAETIRRLNLNFNELTSVDGIQYYERYTRPGNVFFDLDDYLHRIRATTMPTEYNSYKAQLDRTVIFADHTEYFYSDALFNSGTVKINHFSGLNIFIPWSRTESLFPDYRQTEWYKAVYAE